MSGIYIPGMEMPTTGLYFVSVDNTGGKDKTVVTVERMLGNRDVRTIIGSYETVPVPDHGRLIDGDKLIDELPGNLGIRGLEYLNRRESAIVSWIHGAPTIIPADQVKEGET